MFAHGEISPSSICPGLPPIWKPSSVGCKVNVDVATNISDCCFGGGIVIRNFLGCIVFAAAFFYPMFFNVEVSNTRAILVGILCVGKKSLSPVSVDSDALSVMNVCS
ncbi:hypothetical protein ACOSQ2_014434 [Xanthoceras sorbifolium]